MTFPIHEESVRYGDVFQWGGGAIYMFVAWDNDDGGDKEGRQWLGVGVDYLTAQSVSVIRGFRAVRADGTGWERLP